MFVVVWQNCEDIILSMFYNRVQNNDLNFLICFRSPRSYVTRIHVTCCTLTWPRLTCTAVTVWFGKRWAGGLTTCTLPCWGIHLHLTRRGSSSSSRSLPPEKVTSHGGSGRLIWAWVKQQDRHALMVSCHQKTRYVTRKDTYTYNLNQSNSKVYLQNNFFFYI